MPQFDLYTFAFQYFNFLISFLFLYLLLIYFVLPRYSKTIKIRDKVVVLSYDKDSTLRLNRLLKGIVKKKY